MRLDVVVSQVRDEQTGWGNLEYKSSVFRQRMNPSKRNLILVYPGISTVMEKLAIWNGAWAESRHRPQVWYAELQSSRTWTRKKARCNHALRKSPDSGVGIAGDAAGIEARLLVIIQVCGGGW